MSAKYKFKFGDVNVKIRYLTSQLWFKTVLFFLLIIGFKVAFAGSNDFDLSAIDNSVGHHIKGDWGRLLLYIGFGIAMFMAVIKQHYIAFLMLLFAILAISFGPGIIDSVTGG